MIYYIVVMRITGLVILGNAVVFSALLGLGLLLKAAGWVFCLGVIAGSCLWHLAYWLESPRE